MLFRSTTQLMRLGKFGAPQKTHFARVCGSRRRLRSWQHFQQPGDLLRVAGGDPLCRRHYSITKRPSAHWPSPLFSGAAKGKRLILARCKAGCSALVGMSGRQQSHIFNRKSLEECLSPLQFRVLCEECLALPDQIRVAYT